MHHHAGINELITSRIGPAILATADTRIILNHTDATEIQKLAQHLGFTEHEVQLLRSIRRNDQEGYRELFIKQGDFAKIYLMEVAPAIDAILTSSPRSGIISGGCRSSTVIFIQPSINSWKPSRPRDLRLRRRCPHEQPGEVDAGFLTPCNSLDESDQGQLPVSGTGLYADGFHRGHDPARSINGEMMLDPAFILRGVVIWFLPFNYVELMDIISGAVEGFKNPIPAPEGIMTALNELPSSAVSGQQDAPDPNASPMDRLISFAQGAFNFQWGWTHLWVS